MAEFEKWVVEALKAHKGRASILAVAKHIWTHHRRELEADERVFFTWQYQMRWAATKLRRAGRMKPADDVVGKAWELS